MPASGIATGGRFFLLEILTENTAAGIDTFPRVFPLKQFKQGLIPCCQGLSVSVAAAPGALCYGMLFTFRRLDD